MTSANYTYGDSAFAADRLDLLARVFEPYSRAFLERAGLPSRSLALDLGCGPGNTTRLLAQVLGSDATIGLDRSSPFLERARRSAPPGVWFLEHDVTLTPFPVGPADVISCRLLIAHLRDRADVIARWATQLVVGGVLLLDEIETVQSDDPALATYLPLAIGVVGRAGGRLVAGPELAVMAAPPGTERVADDVVLVDLSASDAAAIFRMNLRVLIEQGELDTQPALERALADVVERGGAPIAWKMRQVAFRRTDGSTPVAGGD